MTFNDGIETAFPRLPIQRMQHIVMSTLPSMCDILSTSDKPLIWLALTTSSFLLGDIRFSGPLLSGTLSLQATAVFPSAQGPLLGTLDEAPAQGPLPNAPIRVLTFLGFGQ